MHGLRPGQGKVMTYSKAAHRVLDQAEANARAAHKDCVEPVDLLLALCRLACDRRPLPELADEVFFVGKLFDALGLRAPDVEEHLRQKHRLDGGPVATSCLPPSPECKSALDQAQAVAVENSVETIEVLHLAVGLFLVLDSQQSARAALVGLGGQWTRVLGFLGLERSASSLTAAATPPAVGAAPRWVVGQEVLGLYEVKQFPGTCDPGEPAIKGGMGHVYLVWQRGWKRHLVVKVPNEKLFQKAGGIEGFKREAEEWVRLGLHPNSVSCFYVDQLVESRIPCVFAEYVSGGDLRQWIGSGSGRLYEGRDGQEVLRRVLDIAIQIAWGLQHSHEKGLVHQDVKPANVMMTQQGVAKVTDFGLARARVAAGDVLAAEAADQLLVTYAGGLTPAYCSPEQAISHAIYRATAGLVRQRLASQTDVWSWGLSVLAMFTGGPFWVDKSVSGASSSGTPGALAMSHLRRYLEAPNDIAVGGSRRLTMPDPLAQLLQECFEESPAVRMRRLGSMAAIADKLITIYHEQRGERYRRVQPRAADLLADSLNNQAASMLTLGREDEARRTLENAHRVDPLHLWSRWNYDQYLWGRGELADDAVLGHVLALSRVRDYGREAEDMRSDSAGARIGTSPGPDGPVATPPQLLFDSSVHRGKVTGLCLAGSDLVSAGSDARICVVDTSTGKVQTSFPSPIHEPVSSMSSRVAGGLLAVGGRYGGVWLLDVTRRRFLKPCTLQQHSEAVRSVYVSANGRLLASGGWDKRALLQDRDGAIVSEIDLNYPVEAVAVTDSGQLLAAGWNGGVATPTCRCAFTHTRVPEVGDEASACAMDVLPSCARVLVGWSDGSLLLADSQSGATISRAICGPRKAIESCSLASDGDLGASGGWDCATRVWGFLEGQNAVCLRTFPNADVPVTAVCLSADGDILAIGDMFGRIRVWRLGSMVAVTKQIRAVPTRLSVPPSYDDLARASEELAQAELLAAELEGQGAGNVLEPLRAWQREPGREVDRRALDAIGRRTAGRIPTGIRNAWPGLPVFCDAPVTAVAWSPDGRNVLVGLSSGTCAEHDASKGTLTREYRLAEETITAAVTYTASGRYIAAAGSGNTLHIWARGQHSDPCRIQLGGDTKAPLMAVSDGGGPDTIYATGFGKPDMVWKVECRPDPCPKREAFADQTLWGRSLRLSASGRMIAGVSADGAVRLWSLDDGAMKVEFTGCRGWPIDALAAGPDEQWLLCLDDSGLLTWYDWRASRVTGRFAVHKARPMGIARLAGAGCLATVDAEGLLVLWDLANRCCHPIGQTASAAATCIAASPDGRRLAIGRSGGLLELWDIDWLWPGEAMDRLLDTHALQQCAAAGQSQRDDLLERTIAKDILLLRNQRSRETPAPMVVAHRAQAIRDLNRLAGDVRGIGRFARLLQAYWCGILGEHDMVLKATSWLDDLGRRDAMGWTIRSMAHDVLRRLEEAHDAMRLGDHYGAPESRSFLPHLKTELAADPEDREEPRELSWCVEYGLGRPRVLMTDTSGVFVAAAAAAGLATYGLLALLPQLGMAALAASAAACVGGVAGLVSWTCFRATQPRTTRRRCLRPYRRPDLSGWMWPMLEVDSGNPDRAHRVWAAAVAGLAWSSAGLVLLVIGRASAFHEHGLWKLFLTGLSAAATTWWQWLGLATLLVMSLVPGIRSSRWRRVISFRPVIVHPDAHLFERQGNIVIIDERAIKRVNPTLVKHAKCPRCDSRILLWYKEIAPLAYYDPAKPVRLEKGTQICVQCKECRYRDYAEL